MSQNWTPDEYYDAVELAQEVYKTIGATFTEKKEYLGTAQILAITLASVMRVVHENSVSKETACDFARRVINDYQEIA